MEDLIATGATVLYATHLKSVMKILERLDPAVKPMHITLERRLTGKPKRIIKPGLAEHSYSIQTLMRLGFPEEIIEWAKEYYRVITRGKSLPSDLGRDVEYERHATSLWKREKVQKDAEEYNYDEDINILREACKTLFPEKNFHYGFKFNKLIQGKDELRKWVDYFGLHSLRKQLFSGIDFEKVSKEHAARDYWVKARDVRRGRIYVPVEDTYDVDDYINRLYHMELAIRANMRDKLAGLRTVQEAEFNVPDIDHGIKLIEAYLAEPAEKIRYSEFYLDDMTLTKLIDKHYGEERYDSEEPYKIINLRDENAYRVTFEYHMKEMKRKFKRIQREISDKGFSYIDVMSGAAVSTHQNNLKFVKHLEAGQPFSIKNARSPFFPNPIPIDLDGDSDHPQFIIGGPNKSGKTEAIRTLQLISIFAFLDLPVPADAEIPAYDNRLTFFGAEEDMAEGESYFRNVAKRLLSIIKNATPGSLIIMDELHGSDYWELSALQGAVIRYLDKLGATVILNTHMREGLAAIKDLASVKFLQTDVDVSENGEFTYNYFLRDDPKLEARSYGIETVKKYLQRNGRYERAIGIRNVLYELEETGKIFSFDNQPSTEDAWDQVEVGRRFTPPEGQHLVMPQRKGNKIDPGFRESTEFKSNMYVEAMGDGREFREAVIVPLYEMDVEVTEFDKTADWSAMPGDIRGLLRSGKVLVTDNPETTKLKKSRYSILAYKGKKRDVSGRSGIVLFDGVPVIRKFEGKEFMLEAKGVGVAGEGFVGVHTRGADNYQITGGLPLDASGREFARLEQDRRLSPLFREGDLPRAGARIGFVFPDIEKLIQSSDKEKEIKNRFREKFDGQLSILFRWTPSANRASFDITKEHIQMLGKAFARNLPSIHMSPHFENLSVWGEDDSKFCFNDRGNLEIDPDYGDSHAIEKMAHVRSYFKREVEYSLIDANASVCMKLGVVKNTKEYFEEFKKGFLEEISEMGVSQDFIDELKKTSTSYEFVLFVSDNYYTIALYRYFKQKNGFAEELPVDALRYSHLRSGFNVMLKVRERAVKDGNAEVVREIDADIYRYFGGEREALRLIKGIAESGTIRGKKREIIIATDELKPEEIDLYREFVSHDIGGWLNGLGGAITIKFCSTDEIKRMPFDENTERLFLLGKDQIKNDIKDGTKDLNGRIVPVDDYMHTRKEYDRMLYLDVFFIALLLVCLEESDLPELADRYEGSDLFKTASNFLLKSRMNIRGPIWAETVMWSHTGDNCENNVKLLRYLWTMTHAPLSEETEKKNAQDVRDTIKVMQDDADNSLSFIALGTDWITGYREKKHLQHADLNKLISSMRRFCSKKGIEFRYGTAEEIQDFVRQVKAGDKNARGIVLAGESAVHELEQHLEGIGLEGDKNTLLAAVDNQRLTIDSYIRLTEMFKVTLELFQGRLQDENYLMNNLDSLIDAHQGLGISKERSGKSKITFIPSAEPMHYEELKSLYQVQIFA